ncbi:MAG: dihydrolipoyl dehydrogenase [Eubacteriales bacterium]|nr:dihydrolipoyl dehydrogenase [Eubacteriales bacterium]
MKILILGGGPGGYVAAIHAAHLGAQVTLVEKQYIGGTCLNVGCIPTKVLLNTTDLYHTIKKDGKKMGLKADNLSVDWQKLLERKARVTKSLVGGVETVMASNGIEVIFGEGKFISKNRLEVIKKDGTKDTVDFDRAIIATGSQALVPPIPGIHGENILTSTEILSLEKLPKSLCIVGGGVIGCEFASLFSRLGVAVTVIEMLPGIVQNMDSEIIQYLDYELRHEGVEILTKSKVERFNSTADGVEVFISTPDGDRTVKTDVVLLSIGRKSVVDNLGLEALGVKYGRTIEVNKSFQTNITNIYAVGDCTGGVMLAHAASAQGMAAVENIIKNHSKMDFRTVPFCVYTKPEVASVGMTEEQVKEKNIDYSVGRFPLMSNAKALILGETEGMVKFIVDNSTDEILGMHMAGPKATELIVEGALALRLEATIDEILTTIHAHPTVGEALHEAAHGVHGHPIHMMK